MDHRRGERWTLDLPIPVSTGPDSSLRPGHLVDVSRDGAGLRLEGWYPAIGKPVELWLPARAAPARALVVRADDGMVGLLWITVSPQLQGLLDQARRGAPPPSTRRRPAAAAHRR